MFELKFSMIWEGILRYPQNHVWLVPGTRYIRYGVFVMGGLLKNRRYAAVGVLIMIIKVNISNAEGLFLDWKRGIAPVSLTLSGGIRCLKQVFAVMLYTEGL